MSNQVKIFSLLAFILFLNLFFFKSVGSVGFGLILIAFTILQYFFIDKPDNRVHPSFLISLLGILTVSAFLMVIRAQEFVQAIMVLFSLFVLSSGMVLMKWNQPFFRSLWSVVQYPFVAGVGYVISGFDGLIRLVSPENPHPRQSVLSSKSKKLLTSLIVGLIIAIPVIGVLTVLLTSGDPIFNSFVNGIIQRLNLLIGAEFLKNILNRIILSIIAGVMILPLLRFYRLSKPVEFPKILSKLSVTRELSIVMLGVFLVLMSFLIIQWPYVFARVPFETDLSKFGVATYSEYVKRGFVELILVGVMIYSLVWVGLIALRGKTERSARILRFLQLAVLSEFFILLMSLFRRIYLYEVYHGWTLSRIYGGIFLILLSLMTITLTLRHAKNRGYVKIELISLTLVVLFMGIFNAESFIVNTHPPTVNKHIDYVYLSEMSSDGYEGWDQAYQYAVKTLGSLNINSPLITKDQRREVAYAGTILRTLTHTLDRLVSKYGSSQELRDYYIQIALHVPAYAIQSSKLIGSGAYFNQIKEIDPAALMNLMQNPDSDISSLAKHLYFSPYNRFLDFDSQNLSFSTFYTYSVEDPNPNFRSLSKRPDSMSSVYSWNFSEYRAYHEWMRKYGNFKSFFDIQSKYGMLYQKISNQPVNERDYDVDISMESVLR